MKSKMLCIDSWERYTKVYGVPALLGVRIILSPASPTYLENTRTLRYPPGAYPERYCMVKRIFTYYLTTIYPIKANKISIDSLILNPNIILSNRLIGVYMKCKPKEGSMHSQSWVCA